MNRHRVCGQTNLCKLCRGSCVQHWEVIEAERAALLNLGSGPAEKRSGSKVSGSVRIRVPVLTTRLGAANLYNGYQRGSGPCH